MTPLKKSQEPQESQLSLRVLTERHGSAMHIILNHPERKNALDGQMCKELCTALREADAHSEVRVLVLRSNSHVFCGGGDIKAMKERSDIFAGDSKELARSYRDSIQKIPLTFATLQKPSIALIQGPAIGAGFDLACMCDFRLATPQAKFAESFVTLGLISGIGGAYFLSRLIGHARATELSLTGRLILAEEALNWGILNKLCTDEDSLIAACKNLVDSLSQNSSQALTQAKLLLNHAIQSDLEQHLYLASEIQGSLQTSEDHMQRVRAKLDANSKTQQSQSSESS